MPNAAVVVHLYIIKGIAFVLRTLLFHRFFFNTSFFDRTYTLSVALRTTLQIIAEGRGRQVRTFSYRRTFKSLKLLKDNRICRTCSLRSARDTSVVTDRYVQYDVNCIVQWCSSPLHWRTIVGK